MARPRYHTLVSAGLAYLTARRWGFLGGAGALAMGVGIDLDHLVDHVWSRTRGEHTHYLAPLHGWELAAAASALAAWTAARARRAPWPPPSIVRPARGVVDTLGWDGLAELLAGLALGWWVHLAQDTVSNRPAHIGVYSLAYRMRHGFRREATGWGVHTNFHGWSNQPWYTWF